MIWERLIQVIISNITIKISLFFAPLAIVPLNDLPSNDHTLESRSFAIQVPCPEKTPLISMVLLNNMCPKKKPTVNPTRLRMRVYGV